MLRHAAEASVAATAELTLTLTPRVLLHQPPSRQDGRAGRCTGVAALPRGRAKCRRHDLVDDLVADPGQKPRAGVLEGNEGQSHKDIVTSREFLAG